MSDNLYTEEDVRKIVKEEVTKATKGEKYSYSRWLKDHLVVSILSFIIVIAIILVLSLISTL